METTYNDVYKIWQDYQKKLCFGNEWLSFLKSSTWMYKYSFNEQILIYAQRPDSKACASYDQWKSINRYVKNGSKGIGLLDYNNTLKYVFAAEDTASLMNQSFNLWKLNDNNSLLEWLNEKYQLNTKTVEQALMKIVKDKVDMTMKEVISDVNSFCEGSKIEYLSKLDRNDLVNNILYDSVLFQVFTRLGIDTQDLFDDYTFEDVSFFNTFSMFNILGVTNNLITKDFITELSINIEEINKEREKGNETIKLQDGQEEKSVFTNIRSTSNDGIDLLSKDEIELFEKSERVDAGIVTDEKSTISTFTTEGDGSDENGKTDITKYGSGSKIYPSRSEEGSSIGSFEQSDLQLNLFDFDYEEKNDFSPLNEFVFDIPKDVYLLGFSYGYRNQLKEEIIFEICKLSKPKDSKVNKIKEMLLESSVGIVYDGKKYTVTCTEEGILAAVGSTALNNVCSKNIAWNEFYDLLENWVFEGKYATLEEYSMSEDNAIHSIAENLSFLYRDIKREIYDDIEYDVLNKIKCNTSDEQFLIENIRDEKKLDKMINELNRLDRRFLSEIFDNDKDYFSLSTKISNMIKEVKELKYERKQIINSFFEYEPLQEFFISDDEIDYDLKNGSGVVGGKIRILDAFKNNLSNKSDFLKNEYGIGGRSPCFACWQGSEWHDSKGISYTKNRCEDVILSWNKVSSKINDLIKKGTYISDEKLAQSIVHDYREIFSFYNKHNGIYESIYGKKWNHGPFYSVNKKNQCNFLHNNLFDYIIDNFDTSNEYWVDSSEFTQALLEKADALNNDEIVFLLSNDELEL